MHKKSLLILISIVFLFVSLFVVTLKTKEHQSINSDAKTLPTSTEYIPPTPIVSGDWNYDGVVDEQDEALETH